MNNRLIRAGAKLFSQAAHALEHHPKHVTALVAALMLGGGGGAFAVASLGPEPAVPPARMVLELVQPLPLQEQVAALDVHSFKLFRSELTRSSDSVEGLLKRLGIDDPAAAAFLRSDPVFMAQVMGRPGRTVTAETSDAHALLGLSARWAPDDSGTFKRLTVERSGSGRFASRVDTAPLAAATRLGSGTVRTTLFAAVDDARIPDRVAGQLAEVFSGDIDFRHGLRRGDRFNVVYESLEADGESLRTGRILSAEFVNKGKTHQAVWFQESGKNGGYYTLDGKSLETSYLASPVEFSRVTSAFEMRFHPVLQRWKAHRGVDFGGATGTPVRGVGAGTVEFAGEQNGFGNVVIIDHGKGESTVYAHLSRIDVQTGQAVRQSQTIGAIGATGWVTGPHLHFEFRVNGVHVDPLEIAKHSDAAPLSAAAKPLFDQTARSMRMQLAAAASRTLVASAD